MEKTTETIRIDGMTCGNCVRHVRQALEGVEGLEVSSVEIGGAEVSYDPDEVSREQIIEAIKEEGYVAE